MKGVFQVATVGALVGPALQHVTAKSAGSYRPGMLRLGAEFDDRDVGSIRLPELERLRDTVQREHGEAWVRSARARGRRLRSYDPDAHGKGAAENFVRATRFFFRHALLMGYIPSNPAADLRAPRRPRPPERPLTELELADVWSAVMRTSGDVELDRLLLTFLRHTAARREGCINLAVDHLDPHRGRVTLTEKGGETRELPLSPALGEDLLAFGRTRGGSAPGDSVFRYRNGSPLTRRRFNTIFDHVDRECEWTEPLDVGPHWIRHTTLADIAAVSDIRVAAAFAGHRESSLGVIGRYTKVTFEDLADAYEAVFGR